MKPKVERPLPPDMEKIVLDGHDPKRYYVLHRRGSNLYKLMADKWNIAIYQHNFIFAVFPAYKSFHEPLLDSFTRKYIPNSPLETRDFRPGTAKAYTDLEFDPKEVK